MYGERVSRVPGAVLWWRASPGSGAPQRVLPDGCIDLIWADGALLVAGPDTRAHLVADRPGARYAGLRFGPGTAPAILGVPAHELRDLRVPLDGVWPGAEARRLSERAGEAADPGAALEEAVALRLRGSTGTSAMDGAMDGAMAAVVNVVVDGVRAGTPVAEIAAATGLGERRLHRRCLAAFGYGPRTLGRILRMNRAVDLARSGDPFAVVAAVAGYADQAHLAREVKALTGVTLGALIRP